ncbi:hypothetical protein C2G38_2244843 [Gigaspora rosea]|uniref:Uncharacterized protein n=1 Tax=Gigaspora rosea TaxID=44941 RepID=A0A397VF55_9GLOM|nr:hypothetical protein C2G38_2244843 [Gigaspora rosea]
MKKLMPWINEASVVHKDSLEEIVEMQHQYRRALLRLITGHDTGENNDSVNDEGAWCLRDGCKACQTNSLLKILDLNERFELGIRLIQKIFKKISQFLRYKRCMVHDDDKLYFRYYNISKYISRELLNHF